MESIFIPVIVFLLVYVAITFELVNKAVATFSGVAVLVLLHIVSELQAIEMIDFETIMLLFGMMVIVSILKYSGLFAVVSVKIAELTNGSPVKILVLFSTVTALMSAFLDNVTTVLIIIPIIIELTQGLGLNPKKYVLSQIIISNIGGTATLIGDPPNVIIGSKVGLTFNQFILTLSPVVIVIFCVSLFYIWITNRDQFTSIKGNLVKIFSVQLLLEKIRYEFLHTEIDRRIMIKGLVFLGITILLFVTQTITGLSPGVVALSMGVFLLLVSRVDIEHVLEEIEWSTLMFFAGLFILVGVLEEKGVIEWIAHHIFLGAGDNPYTAVLLVLWSAGIISGFLDNIPFTITMIPIVQIMLENNPIPNNLLWWALALGACLGGNITIIGASANIVSVGISKKYGVNISFIEFMKTGMIISFISLTLASLYLMGYLWIVL